MHTKSKWVRREIRVSFIRRKGEEREPQSLKCGKRVSLPLISSLLSSHPMAFLSALFFLLLLFFCFCQCLYPRPAVCAIRSTATTITRTADRSTTTRSCDTNCTRCAGSWSSPISSLFAIYLSSLSFFSLRFSLSFFRPQFCCIAHLIFLSSL